MACKIDEEKVSSLLRFFDRRRALFHGPQVSDKYKFVLILVYKDASRTFVEMAEPLGKFVLIHDGVMYVKPLYILTTRTSFLAWKN